MTALALCGALALTASCAGNGGGTGGATGSNGGTTGTSNGGTVVTSNGGSTVTTPTGGVTAPSGNAVTFNTGKASGAMTGYGWIAMGPQDSASSPTCGTTNATISNAAACTTTTNWSSATSLCISGAIPLVTPDTAFPTGDYTADWGLQIGVNATDATPSGTLGSNAASFTKITFTTSGAVAPTTAAIRAEIHRLGDPDATTYCANMTSGTPITLTAFNTACWDGSGTSLTSADITNIDKVGVQISSDTSSAYTVTNYCLSGISFQ